MHRISEAAREEHLRSAGLCTCEYVTHVCHSDLPQPRCTERITSSGGVSCPSSRRWGSVGRPGLQGAPGRAAVHGGGGTRGGACGALSAGHCGGIRCIGSAAETRNRGWGQKNEKQPRPRSCQEENKAF